MSASMRKAASRPAQESLFLGRERHPLTTPHNEFTWKKSAQFRLPFNHKEMFCNSVAYLYYSSSKVRCQMTTFDSFTWRQRQNEETGKRNVARCFLLPAQRGKNKHRALVCSSVQENVKAPMSHGEFFECSCYSLSHMSFHCLNVNNTGPEELLKFGNTRFLSLHT